MKISVAVQNLKVNVRNDDGELVANVEYTDYVGEVDIAAAIRGGLTIATLLEAAVKAAADESTSAE